MASRSVGVRCWVLRSTTSAMGPVTQPRAETPVCSSATTSARGQSATLASWAAVSEGAYQFCIGIRPPDSGRRSSLAPQALRVVWQATQWPRPRTR